LYFKICPECKSKSYSACKKGEWNCPKCGCDLSQNEAERPGKDDKCN